MFCQSKTTSMFHTSIFHCQIYLVYIIAHYFVQIKDVFRNDAETFHQEYCWYMYILSRTPAT